jgi:hypothetical protein
MVNPSVGSRKRVRTGIALSPTALVAADIRLRGATDRAWRATLEPPSADGSSWSSLASALSDLARAIGATDGSLSIALLPPLTEVRRLELPPLSDDDLHQALARHAARYFVGARSAQVVGASVAGKRVRGAPTPVIATAASARLVATIRAVAQQAGWSVETIAPAESAWAAAALSRWPAFAKQNAFAVIVHADRTDLLQLENGRLAGVRRFRAAQADADMIASTIGGAPRGEIGGDEAPLLAAQFAGMEVGPTLRSIDAVALERQRARRATWMLGGVAAALFIAAAGVHLWGLHHQLQDVRDERARLKPQLSSTLLGRTNVDVASRHLSALAEIDRTSPRWSHVIAALSDAIPEEAYLTAVRGRQDSVIVDGLAEHAAQVFDALEKSKVFVDVKAAAPVRREHQDDGTALDRFTIAGRLAPPGVAAPLATAAVSATTRRVGQ